MTRVTRRASAIMLTMIGLILSCVSPAFAEGPGYGGNADTLAVSWELKKVSSPVDPSDTPEKPQPSTAPSEAAPSETSSVEVPVAETTLTQSAFLPSFNEPQLNLDEYVLQVNGLGFRGKSEVEVRIGSDNPVVARADSAGAMTIQLEANRIGSTLPGVSVMAVGRNQAGTEVALFGSIPPVSSGSGPMMFLPWIAVAVVMGWLLMTARRKFLQQTNNVNSPAHV